MVILGLDISTRTVGYCYSDEGNEILMAGFIDVSFSDSFKEKANYVIGVLHGEVGIEPDKIIVEDSLSGFARGKTSQQTIIKLAKFHAVLSYLLEESFHLAIDAVNPNTARKELFGKARRKGVPSKEFVREQLETMIEMNGWCVETSRGNWDKRNSDMYDATVVSLYGQLES